MPDSIRSLGPAAVAACLFAFIAIPAAAQSPLSAPPSTAQFMSRYDFHLSAAGLAEDDERFTWDTHFGGDFDLVDYVRGRMIFIADYQAVLGSEFRPFDPNQGNYTLAAAGSVRAGGTEFVGVLHHVSRHLGDRPKRVPIAWNEIDLRVLRQLSAGGSTIDMRVDGGAVIERANVDYLWTGSVDVTIRRDVRPGIGVFGKGMGRIVGVNEMFDRDRQWGGRVEGGVRFFGQGGGVELMVGAERVIDADPFERLPMQWLYAGFRIVTNPK